MTVFRAPVDSASGRMDGSGGPGSDFLGGAVLCPLDRLLNRTLKAPSGTPGEAG